MNAEGTSNGDGRKPHVNWTAETKDTKGGRLIPAHVAKQMQEAEEAEKEKAKRIPTSLKHFANTLPGFTAGAGARQKIEPWPFKDLLEHKYAVTIPLFQRKYCWEKAQGDKWWSDLVAMPLEKCKGGSNHGVGSIVFCINETEGILCVDGQQRITTTSLLVSAIRDRLLREVRHLNASSNPEDEGSVGGIKGLIERLNGYLFMDPRAALEWAASTPHGSTPTTGGEGSVVELQLDAVLSDGVLLPFSRLKPSHIDRQPYFQCIMQGLIEHDEKREGNTKTVWGSVAEESLQGQMKRLFDDNINSYFEATQSQEGDGASSSSASAFLLLAEALVTKSILGMGFMYVEMLNEVNLAQVFLYLQEKSMFGYGSLLHNESPGLDFRASDMVRNLLLAPTMNWPLHVQEQLHMQYWVKPIEGCYRRPADIDRVLTAFLAEDEAERNDLKEVCEMAAAAQARRKEKKAAEATTEASKEQPEKEVVEDDNAKLQAALVGDEEEKENDVEKRQEILPPGFGERYVSDFEKQVFKIITMFKTKKVGKQQTEGMELYGRFYSYYEHELMEQWKYKQQEEKDREESQEDTEREPSSALTVTDDCEEVSNRSFSWTKQLSPEEQSEWELDCKILACLASNAKDLKAADAN